MALVRFWPFTTAVDNQALTARDEGWTHVEGTVGGLRAMTAGGGRVEYYGGNYQFVRNASPGLPTGNQLIAYTAGIVNLQYSHITFTLRNDPAQAGVCYAFLVRGIDCAIIRRHWNGSAIVETSLGSAAGLAAGSYSVTVSAVNVGATGVRLRLNVTGAATRSIDVTDTAATRLMSGTPGMAGYNDGTSNWLDDARLSDMVALPAPQIISPASGAIWAPPYSIELQPGAAFITALDFPGSPSFPSADPSIIMGWNQLQNGVTVPPLSGGFTAIWRAWPRAMQAAYWSGFFHTMYGTNWTTVSAKRYCGMHPYPEPSEGGATRNLWEISAMGGDTYDDTPGDPSYSRITEYQRWYQQAARATLVAGNVDYEFLFDIEAGYDRKIVHEDDNKADPTAAERTLSLGDALWNPGREIYNGLLRGFIYYSRSLSDAEIAQAIVDPLSVSGIFYLNLNPTPDDITDKSGQGNHPTWFTTERASLWQEAA